MARMSLSSFVNQHAEQSRGEGVFELESERVLEINLGAGGGAGATEMIWMKLGAMIAYRGDIKFEREGMLEQGLGNLLKKAVSGEGAILSRARGNGALYVADGGKLITVLELNNDSLIVNGSDLVAFTPTLKHDITMMRKLSAIASGGLFNVKVTGTGMLALGTHGKPMALRVTPSSPVFTDPQAMVAWSASLSPEFKTDIQLKTLLGRGSGESFQMAFRGEGFVVVQPYEERAVAAAH
jgi:uncharacterized protein (AIM24 family)